MCGCGGGSKFTRPTVAQPASRSALPLTTVTLGAQPSNPNTPVAQALPIARPVSRTPI